MVGPQVVKSVQLMCFSLICLHNNSECSVAPYSVCTICPDDVWNLTPDKPHCSDPGRKQEEDLHKETSLHVCLCSAYHCLPPHTATAGHHCGSLPHGAPGGRLCVF